ncbi:MAG: PAS domain S-box protein [Dehalococcoidia bacterium]|nr:MAG: PAS domain S-box protein [Dehalococcoidia bacterium]
MKLEELDRTIGALEGAHSTGASHPADAAPGPPATRSDHRLSIALENLRRAREELARLDGEVRSMQDALDAERSRVRGMFESASDPSVAISVVGRIIAVNEPALKLFGYERGELVGELVDALIPERFLEAHRQAQSVAAPAPREAAIGVGVQLCARHRDGHEIPVEISVIPHRVRSGMVTLGIIHDVSEKVEAASAVARQRDVLRLVADSLPAFIAYVDHDLRYLFANKPFREWFGVPAEDEITGSMRDVLGARVFGQVEPFVQRVLRGETVSFERATRYADGSPASLHVTYVPDAETEPGRNAFFVLVNDVTEHKNAERALQETSTQLEHRVAELEALLDVVPIGVAIAEDAKCQVIRPNRELARILRMAEGANASSTAPIDDRPAHFAMTQDGEPIPVDDLPMQVAARTGQPVLNSHMEVVFEDASVTPIYGQAVPLFDADGRTRGAVGAFVDITAIQRIQDELRRANAVKDEFLGLVSHELKTPITTILGNAEVLLKRTAMLDENERAGAVSDIHDEASRLHAIIDNLLVLARLESGRTIEREPVLLQRLVARSAHWHVHRNPHRSVNVRYEGSLPPAYASVTYVEQVLSNMLSNAEKYSPPDTPIGIEIRVEDAAAQILVSVCDQGVGIPAEEIDSIFTPFYRSPRTSGRTQGFGIGLAVCRRLIEVQDGRMWAEPRAEGGTRFTFALPIAGDDVEG